MKVSIQTQGPAASDPGFDHCQHLLVRRASPPEVLCLLAAGYRMGGRRWGSFGGGQQRLCWARSGGGSIPRSPVVLLPKIDDWEEGVEGIQPRVEGGEEGRHPSSPFIEGIGLGLGRDH